MIVEKKKSAITVKNLHIKYRTIKKLSIRKSLFKLKKAKSEYFEAVKGVSFNVEQGKIIGIIGKNGAGKTTTMKMALGLFFLKSFSQSSNFLWWAILSRMPTTVDSTD